MSALPAADGHALHVVASQIRQVAADETPGVAVIVAAIHAADIGAPIDSPRTVWNDLLEPSAAIAIDLLKGSGNGTSNYRLSSEGTGEYERSDPTTIHRKKLALAIDVFDDARKRMRPR